MNSIGKNIKRLRLCKGDTQEKLADALHISCQAVSKWENGNAAPDIAILPLLADYFDITIDELMNHKLNAYTSKDRFVRLLYNSGVLSFHNNDYHVNTENFATNAQLSKIGECFADFIFENKLTFDGIAGLAYHGIGFSASTSVFLYQKYGISTAYFYDRKVPDSRSRRICGYTPKPGDRIIVIDDVIGSGITLDERLEYLTKNFEVNVSAVIAIISLQSKSNNGMSGEGYIRQKYNTTVYTLITDQDIRNVYP